MFDSMRRDAAAGVVDPTTGGMAAMCHVDQHGGPSEDWQQAYSNSAADFFSSFIPSTPLPFPLDDDASRDDELDKPSSTARFSVHELDAVIQDVMVDPVLMASSPPPMVPPPQQHVHEPPVEAAGSCSDPPVGDDCAAVATATAQEHGGLHGDAVNMG
jgi:hypothetical protein